jgi:hypothetical protein
MKLRVSLAIAVGLGAIIIGLISLSHFPTFWAWFVDIGGVIIFASFALIGGLLGLIPFDENGS